MRAPLYKPKGVSLETIIFPVAKKPLGLAPGVLDALRLSCMRTLMVSRLRVTKRAKDERLSCGLMSLDS